MRRSRSPSKSRKGPRLDRTYGQGVTERSLRHVLSAASRNWYQNIAAAGTCRIRLGGVLRQGGVDEGAGELLEVMAGGVGDVAQGPLTGEYS